MTVPDYYKLPDGKELHEIWSKEETLSYFKLSAMSHLYRAGKKEGETELDAAKNAKGCIDKYIELLEKEESDDEESTMKITKKAIEKSEAYERVVSNYSLNHLK